MEQSDHIPKISIYKPPVDEKSGLTFKPVLAGMMIIIVNISLMVMPIFSVYYIFSPLTIIIGISFFSISIYGGVCAIKRIRHKFTLLCTVLTFIGGLGMGYAFLAIIPFFLIVISDDEFTS